LEEEGEIGGKILRRKVVREDKREEQKCWK